MNICAPAAETAWLLHTVIGFDALEEADTRAVLEQATEFAAGVLAPLDQVGDRVGAQLRDGAVIMPPGFDEAFRAYAAAGWIGMTADPEHGGQGLPDVLALAAFEPVSAANMAFGLTPMLTLDAVSLLRVHGTAEQKVRLMGQLVTGEWTGTMCLTEPQSGSDLSGVRTRAEPDGTGGFLITGEKIYITGGEHGMARNILHMVLARLPDAPAGSAGISLFAVPKLIDGAPNGVRCLSLEHKLGIRASPTCVMSFEAARGEMVGAPHRGLPAMFAMMNAARLGVAMQGVAVAERSFRRAVDFAGQRVQGGGPIVQHPDVRRMLLTMRALGLGGRLLTLYAGLRAEEPVGQLLIPVAKAWSTDAGVEAASLGVQVHGGMGFIEETGAAQHLRDARIAPIYEGTNGIQALTLLRRGILRDQGAALEELLAEIAAADFASPALLHAADATRAAGVALRQAEPRRAEAGAHTFLQMLGTLTAAWLCARVVARADAPAATSAAAQAFLSEILPRTAWHAGSLAANNEAITGFQDVA